jgi:thioredoxin 1
MTSPKIHELDAASFESIVKRQDATPVLVDFWAPWCGPCKAIGPVLDQLADELDGKALITKVNVDDQSALASQFNVRAIPTLLLFKKGQVVDTIVGLANKDALKQKIEAQL